MNKPYLLLNNLQWLICHKIKPNHWYITMCKKFLSNNNITNVNINEQGMQFPNLWVHSNPRWIDTRLKSIDRLNWFFSRTTWTFIWGLKESGDCLRNYFEIKRAYKFLDKLTVANGSHFDVTMLYIQTQTQLYIVKIQLFFFFFFFFFFFLRGLHSIKWYHCLRNVS